jgi:uncharacterized repeat protein (TIGR01451 family)
MQSFTPHLSNFLVRRKFFRINTTRCLLLALILLCFVGGFYFAPDLFSRRQIPSRASAGTQPNASGVAGEHSAISQVSSGENIKAPASGVVDARVREVYGRLPIAFEDNAGQYDDKVKYSARGSGFQLFLTSDEAVLALNKPSTREHRRGHDPQVDQEAAEHSRATGSGAVLRMKLVGANRRASVTGENELASKSNYLVGAKPEDWHTDVAMFEKVRYTEVYPGIDVVYYGNQRQLEYDFVLAPHADPARIKFKFSGSKELHLDPQGHLLLLTDGGSVRQEKPVIYQLVDGRRQEIAGRYTIKESGEIGFKVGRYDRSQPLVIDPVLSYSTYLGGTGSDRAFGIALDGQGNAYITGETISTDFPTANALQASKATDFDAFVLKLNPSGSALVYATYFGSNDLDSAYGIAVDAAGNAYITGVTYSDFMSTSDEVQGLNAGGGDAFVTKLNAAGNRLIYSSYLGGENLDQGYGVAVDAAGNAYVTGETESNTFLGVPMPKQGNPIYKSGDAGVNWSAHRSGLPDANVAGLTIDPTNSSILYAATASGVFKSLDRGVSWSLTGRNSSNVVFSANSVAVDPSNPARIYAGTFGSGVYRSMNGGESWGDYEGSLSGFAGVVLCVVVDPNNSSTLYAGTFDRVYKSMNGGASWAQAASGFAQSANRINKIIFDPADSKILYAATNVGIYKSVNNATTWTALNNGLLTTSGTTPSVTSLVISPASPATIYAGTSVGVFKSTDGGLNWVSSNDGLRVQIPNGGPFIPSISTLAISPAEATTIYAGSTQGGVFKSTDGGAHWAASNNGLANINVTSLAVDHTAAATLYASTNSLSDGFVVKLDATGENLGYLRYLGGHEDDYGGFIAVDAGGNAYVTGDTRSTNFPTLNPLQAIGGGPFYDAFVTKLGSDGSTVYSTYLGGIGTDRGIGIAVNAAGNAYVTGSTNSTNFPTAGPRQTSNISGTDAFVSKLSLSGSSLDFSIFHGGNLTDQGSGIALDASGNTYVTGSTTSSNFPVLNGVQAAHGGGNDAFILKLNPASDVIYSTYLGGSSSDQGFCIAVDSGESVYIAGPTNSSNFPTASPLQAFNKGSNDAFIAKISTSILDLSVSITDAPDPVVLGGDLTYTIKVSNLSALTATGVRLSDTLPAGSTLVSASASTGTCSGVNPVTCELGSVASGASATVTIVIKPPAVRAITNTANVTANEPDVNIGNNSASQATLVDFADLSVTAAALQGFVNTGGRVTYVLAASNNGGTPAGNVNINIGLPPGLTLVSCTTPGGACGGAGNNLTVALPTLAVNASQSVTIIADVNSGVAEGATLPVTVNASSSLPDPDPANNSATATATVSSILIKPKRNGKIAFTTVLDGLYVMNDDGTNITLIYNAGAERSQRAVQPTWSPDGVRIAFVTGPLFGNSGSVEVRVVNADGSDPRALSTNGISRPTWSPSGAFVGFISRDGKSIRVVNATGNPTETTLFTTTSELRYISWSPDGTKLVYSTSNFELWTVNVDGSSPKLLDSDPNTRDDSPVWSPDGAKIMFIRGFLSGQNSNSRIYTMNADGTNAQPLPHSVSSTGLVQSPVYSPDGTMIAFQDRLSPNGDFFDRDLLKANMDGTNVTRIPATGQSGHTPSWQPLPASTPTPTPVPTFNISGRVTPPSGISSFVTGQVRLDVTGSSTTSVVPDSNGNYSFTLPAGGNYTITPAVNPYYNFNPGSYTFNNLSADQPAANFTTTHVNYSISGRVTDPNGAPLGNVEITLQQGGTSTATRTTGADGTYLFDQLQYNGSHTIFVSLSSRTDYNFSPGTRTFLLTQNEVVNFVGTPRHSFQVSSGSYVVGEGDGRVNVVVNRTGIPATMTAPASVLLQTYDDPAAVPCDPMLKKPDGTAYPQGTAYARCDYATKVETVQFAPGETQKTVSIPIIDDAHVEETEVALVSLSHAVGATLETPLWFNIVIHDNDSGTAENPTKTTSFFVRQQYLDFLSREPEAGEPWSGVLNGCANPFNLDPQNPSALCDRIIVSQSFFGSPEFRLKGFFVYNFYRVAFDRRPDYAEVIPDMSVLSGATAAEVYARRAALPVSFTARQEFKTRYDGMSDTAYVNALLDRYGLQQITMPDPQQPEAGIKVTLTRAELVNRLGAAGAQAFTRAQVLRAVVESDEVGAIEYKGAFVAMQYYGYLRRTPEESGYQAWLRVINEDPNNIRIMVNGFMNSTEYRLRFGQP